MIRAPHSIRTSVVLGAAAAVLATIAIASPASASVGTLTSVKASELPTLGTNDESVVESTLQELAGTQSAAEIEQVIHSGLPGATLMDETNTHFVAAVILTPSLRALTPVGPGCSGDSLCMQTSGGTPYGYTGAGSKSGTWKDIKRASANGRNATFKWTAGSVTVAKGLTNVFGSPVTMTQVSR